MRDEVVRHALTTMREGDRHRFGPFDCSSTNELFELQIVYRPTD